MTKQPTTAPPNNGGDEVERSLELLDRVLSEFDDLENGNVSLEDDGYMSMNGRRLKAEFPPPPEEAQRIISTLLPRVSPSNSNKRNVRRGRLHTSLTLGHEARPELKPITAATQTTIPKTRHQRPFGWQNGNRGVPPRTVATAGDRHREVRREDPAFSDDSLEDVPPPPPPTSKRGSIAWEVPLDDEEALYTPGSTKVIGRRRRRSTDRSSSGSMGRLRDSEEWPDPPTGTEDGSCSPLSDSSHLDSSTASRHEEEVMSTGGTYVIRRGRQRQRKPVPIGPEPPPTAEFKRGSSTFDNIKSLLREGLIEGLDEAPPDFPPPTPPGIIRVVSLPSLDTKPGHRYSLEAPNEEDEDQAVVKHDVAIQATEEVTEEAVQAGTDDSESERGKSIILLNGTDTSSNEALMAELRKEYDTESMNNNEHTVEESALTDPWLTAAEVSQVQVIPVVEKIPEEVPEEKPPKEFKVKVEVLQHEFGPLPPSPVEEDDEYSDILKPSPAQTPRGVSNEKREPFYRCLEPPASDPLGTKILNKSGSEHHKDGTSSLKTRSMDAGFSRNHRTQHSSSSSSSAARREVPSERRTLPTELQGPSRRRTLQKRASGSREEGQMQVSCSLPETPIFTRGCDIPRTPHRRAPDVPMTSRTTPRQLPSAAYRSVSHSGGAGMSLSEAMAGAELLRLAGGPGRGWYPRHRQPRPASVEHLDRLPPLWDHKPQTLPPNITPKFYRSPRDALRRVTSLLIRRGNSKEKKDPLSPTAGMTGEGGEGSRQKKGFFRSFWKRSRHYSLEQQ
ncbi:uncharacterized protein [Halyomorpha halys]|uniref:uncharacterized protein isoform X2 n=1 Tax=Halyomorpha halys TaxID=286706 RepID=UPI0034D22149